MLIEKMHNLTNSKVSKFILGLITVSFLVGGMSGYLFSSNDTYAAKVKTPSSQSQLIPIPINKTPPNIAAFDLNFAKK